MDGPHFVRLNGCSRRTARCGAGRLARAVVDPVIGGLIARGIGRSPTFRELVAAINASDSYVYVKKGDCGAGVHSCFIAVTDSGLARFLWVKVNSRKMDDGLVSLIGHELRHTLEVIDEPAVRSNGANDFFYGRIGTHLTIGTIETRGAVVTRVIRYGRHCAWLATGAVDRPSRNAARRYLEIFRIYASSLSFS